MAESLDFEALRSWAETLPAVGHVEVHDLFCSPAGKAAYLETLRQGDFDGVVMAACTPKMHEETFRRLTEEAGLNLAQLQIANIREHCAWVTPSRDDAMAKAKSLIAAALRRVVHAEALQRRSIPLRTEMLVLGGGVAGMEAALTAARAGRQVYLVERAISLGGAVIQTEEVAPSLECSPCLLAPLLAAVRDEPNIEVLSGTEVAQVVGFLGNFGVRLRQRAGYVGDDCPGCEACYEVCPVERPSAFHRELGSRKAIHALFAGSVPAAAVIERDECLHFIDGSCDACVAACPFEVIDFSQQDRERTVEVGAIVLATGAASPRLENFPELGYGRYPEVYSLAEAERLLASNGPTGGQLLRRDGEAPRSLALLHCAGSRRPDGLSYCSGICCGTALKLALLARKQLPELVVHQVYEQLVLVGDGPQRLCDAAVAAGTRLLRTTDPESLRVEAQDALLLVQGAGFDALTVDMVILVDGMAPSPANAELAALLHLERDAAGFFAAAEQTLHPTAASLDGIYRVGGAAGPCSVASAATQGRAAVGDALSRLVPGRELTLEILTARIEAERCAGCRLCAAACPYLAIGFDEAQSVCQVNEAICRGCGTCAAGCPSGACQARHFNDEQIYAELGGLIDG